jgi:DNA-binding beta-propeller fold protein YncE
VYAAAEDSTSGLMGVAAFARDQANGALAQLAGVSGCVAPRGRGGCARGRTLDDAHSVAVSPDGRSVYVASPGGERLSDSGGVAVFARSLG